jgi:hypothetical protein
MGTFIPITITNYDVLKTFLAILHANKCLC